MASDIPSNRRSTILARLSAGQPVRSGALAEEFGLSEDAIRRDLRSLAADGLCRRVYGGALPLTQGSVPIAQRFEEGAARKRSLAGTAVTLVAAGSTVFLDNGSTNLAMAAMLPHGRDLSVATGSIAIAAILQDRDDIDLVMIGGAVDRVIGGAIDGTALEAIARLNIDLCVLGACALSAKGGVSAFETADAAFKRALLARSRSAIVLATNDKLGQQAPQRIAAVDAIDRIVLEHDAPVDAENELAGAGATIIRATA
jgi:DeoR/GlpR family transcriptional regulator of sugar metabolism